MELRRLPVAAAASHPDMHIFSNHYLMKAGRNC